ncbi:MAG: hypothetical protein Kow0058_10530 [Roseovarius sp.]
MFLVLNGGPGDDPLIGTTSDDVLNGLGGDDTLLGLDGSDELFGGSGNDSINPGENDGSGDGVEAGTGNDTIDFVDIVQGWVGLNHFELSEPITVNIDGLANTGSIATASQGVDTLLDVANPLVSGWTTGGLSVRGTGGDDSFTINTDFQQWGELVGLGGNDSFTITGNGLIRLGYHFSNGAVTADLGAGTIQQDGFTDTVTGHAWEIRAGNGNDSLLGSAGDESFIGQGGNDTIDGADGFDRVRYDRTGYSGVDVDLAAGTAQGSWNGGAFTDHLSNIEWVRGSAFADDIFGDINDNKLEGRDGDDFIRGRGGDDTLLGDAGNDTLVADTGDDVATGGNGADIFAFIVGGNDTLSITDFEPGVDDLALVGLPSGFTATDLLPFVSQIGADVVIAAGNQVVRFENTLLSDLSASDVIFV